jgi:hypothetical protein
MPETTKKFFAFRPSAESIQHFKNASAEAKLNWLEKAACFVQDFVPCEKIERWKKVSGRE